MNILVVSQYFWPENFRINDLCSSLVERGHKVTVLTGEPNYPDGELYTEYRNSPEKFDELNGVRIIRVPLRPRKKGSVNLALNYLSFVLSGSVIGSKKLKGQDYDLIFVCQLSPVTAAIPAIVLKKFKKIPLVMWSLDLWPESLQAVGVIKSPRVIEAVGKMVSWIYKHCDVILGQSQSYLEAINRRDPSSTPTFLFPNWAEEQFALENTVQHFSRDFKVLFAGNVGDAQDFESIVEAAKIIKSEGHDHIVFSIVGSGRKSEWLNEQIIVHELQSLFVIHGKHPLEAMPDFYAEADIALVSLVSDEALERIVPGKMQSYMLAALPVVAMLDGEGRQLVQDAQCGLAGPSSDGKALASNIISMSQLCRQELLQLGLNGREYSDRYFNKERLLDSLEATFHSVVSPSISNEQPLSTNK